MSNTAVISLCVVVCILFAAGGFAYLLCMQEKKRRRRARSRERSRSTNRSRTTQSASSTLDVPRQVETPPLSTERISMTTNSSSTDQRIDELLRELENLRRQIEADEERLRSTRSTAVPSHTTTPTISDDISDLVESFRPQVLEQRRNASSNASAVSGTGTSTSTTRSGSTTSTNAHTTTIPAIHVQPTVRGDVVGPVNYYANSNHGKTDNWFQFQYEKQSNGDWYAYIQRAPSYQERSQGLHETHRYHDPNTGRYWICYDPQPKTLKDIQNVSRIWADKELEYIKTGTRF